VALIVVGPKDLPVLFRRVGQFVGKMRGMAREFSRAMNDAADEAGVRDVQEQIKAATNPVGSAMDGVRDAARSMANPVGSAMDSVKDATTSLKNPLEGIDPDSETGKLASKRAAQKAAMDAKMARSAAERKAREAREALAKAEEFEAKAAELPLPKDNAALPSATSSANEPKDA